MSHDQNTMTMNQSGKTGGDATGCAASYSGSAGGDASGIGTATVRNVDPIGTGIGIAGDAMSGSGAMAATGGDAADNTSIGSININS